MQALLTCRISWRWVKFEKKNDSVDIFLLDGHICVAWRHQSRRRDMKILNAKIAAITIALLLASTSAFGWTVVNAVGYGVTQAGAAASAEYQLRGAYPDVESVSISRCTNPSVGPPWKCTVVGQVPGGSSSCDVGSLTAYGTTLATASEAALHQWTSTYGTEAGVSCQSPSVGPPWQCTATGCTN